MPDQLLMFDPLTLEVLHSAISSPALAAGHSPCNSPAGQPTGQCGPDRVHANHFPVLASTKASTTPVTYGQCSQISSRSASLTSSLASKLKARLATVGSMEYTQTWREKVTPSGLAYWAHTASAHRIADNACIGWPSPTANPNDQPEYRTDKIHGAAKLTAWPTPRAEDSESTGAHNGTPDTLTSASRLTAWPTTAARDWRDCRSNMHGANAMPLNEVAGLTTPPSHVGTGRPAEYQLNPHFSRWLMGFPPAWCDCAVTAMLSFPKSRRSS